MKIRYKTVSNGSNAGRDSRARNGTGRGRAAVVGRRRGATLLRAIYTAVLHELQTNGLARLTIDGVAERAGASRSSLYRRWPTPEALALAAIASVLPARRGPAPNTGKLRDDLFVLLQRFQSVLRGPLGDIVLSALAEHRRRPDFAATLRRYFFEKPSQIEQALTRAKERGEIAGYGKEISQVAPAMMTLHYLLHGTTPNDHALFAIIDEVILPAVSKRGQPSREKKAPRDKPRSNARRR